MRGLVLAALLALPAAAQSPTERGVAVAIALAPVQIAPTRLDGLRLLGAWVMTSDHPAFGGLSGMLVEGGALTAVTDQAHWLTARLAPGGAITEAKIAPILGRSRVILDKSGGDAEALARRGDDLIVGFEHDHRIARHLGSGRVGGDLRARAFQVLGANQGIEALATLPDGRLLGLAEGADDAATPVFVIARDGTVASGTLPRTSPHLVTGADLGADGRLYVVLRHFSIATGVDIQIHRYALGPDGMPDPASLRVLAEFGPASGIDNMEAIALDGDRLWLMSDNNFNALQRTLLLEFALAP